MINSPDLAKSNNERRSLTECMTELIRTGKDAQMMLEPLRSFCEFVGLDEETCRNGDCKDSETLAALSKHLDALHRLFESWDVPSFSTRVPDALALLKEIFRVVDRGIFREDVGTWNTAWYSLYNAVANKRRSAARFAQHELLPAS